jgi:ABC transporter substrate binding protein
MRRREFIAGLVATTWPLAVRAQQLALPVIGFLHTQSLETMRDKMAPFAQGLAETGFVEGRNVSIEHRWGEGQTERRRALVADLVRRQVSLIIADTTNGGTDAKAATQTIPIIFMAGADPVEFGLVSSLNRPGAPEVMPPGLPCRASKSQRSGLKCYVNWRPTPPQLRCSSLRRVPAILSPAGLVRPRPEIFNRQPGYSA